MLTCSSPQLTSQQQEYKRRNFTPDNFSKTDTASHFSLYNTISLSRTLSRATTAAAVNALHNLAFLQLRFGNSADAVGREVCVSRLEMVQHKHGFNYSISKGWPGIFSTIWLKREQLFDMGKWVCWRSAENVSHLDASQTTEVLVALLLPLGDESSVSNPLLEQGIFVNVVHNKMGIITINSDTFTQNS